MNQPKNEQENTIFIGKVLGRTNKWDPAKKYVEPFLIIQPMGQVEIPEQEVSVEN